MGILSKGGIVQVRRQIGREQGGSSPGQVESRCANTPESDRRQIPFKHRAVKITPGDGIQLEAWHRIVFAIAFDLSMINVVVAEATEEEIGELIERVTKGNAGRISKPDRRMAPGKCEAKIKFTQNFRNGVAIDMVRGGT